MSKRTPQIFTATSIVLIFLSFLSILISCTDEDLLDQILEAEELYNEEMLLEERGSDSSEEASDEEYVVVDEDSDEDGVPDEADKCNNTAKGEDVNADGCSKSQADSDGDGVTDDLDQCPNTGENEEVDENGCSEAQKDSDGDGVKDADDKCPNTPEGEEVNEEGCSETQTDSDGDGVSDDNDDCPDTPEGEYVDENGCSDTQKDSDGDGVTDDKDQCKDSPADTEVNEFGCSDSQTDGDEDGISNELDECPNTPAGETVDAKGCSVSQKDADKDGVTDDLDQCANTPSGETVDANGCSESQKDADEDGVTNDKDECPNTPSGETVDANGCSASQKDSDKDGVSNKLDKCANTPSGATVDSNGCAESQKDADGDGIADSADQCPDTPNGQSVNSTGCSASQRDSDGDGVNDAKDQCASTPSGASVDGNGCSESQKDSDGDGVTDNNDQCPGTPAGENVDNTGCSVAEDDTDQGGTGNEQYVDYDGLIVNITPCEYSLNTLEAGQSLEINCRIDLQGQTVNLPSSVTLQFNKGEIINGTLNFNGGNIDGRLLNKDLEITGQARLINENFEFYPARWDFVQGTINSDRAQQNTFNLEDLFEFTKGLGARSFLMDKFDAYFEISKVTSTTSNQNFYPSLEAINIPANYNVIMTGKTHLRTQPNSASMGALVAFRNVTNSSIKGGTLHGDRDQHDYSGSGAGEGGTHVITVHGASNVLMEGVTILNGSKGGLNINSTGFTFQPNYIPSQSITIRGCRFIKNRRMAVALTDGTNILFDGNEFIDTGLPTSQSDGGVVGWAINMEAVRKKDASGNFIFYEKVTNVTLRNNIERGSRVGAFLVYTGENITIENNQFESKVGWVYASNTKIRNNNFVASSKSAGSPAINALGSGETVFNNEIFGNRVSGYGIAIAAYTGNMRIFGNELINNNVGIQLKEISNTQISNNLIQSPISSSRGISISITDANDVDISNNIVDVQSNHLYFVQMNWQGGMENNKVRIFENDFTGDSSAVFSSSKGVDYSNNSSVGRISIINATNVSISNSQVLRPDHHGITLTRTNYNISLTSNKINYPGNSRFECINIEDTTSLNEVNMSNNTCIEY